MRRILIIGSIGLFAMACGGSTAPVNTNTNAVSANVPANNTNSGNTNASTPANANKPANSNVAKAAESGPKRVSFAAGKSEGNEVVTLGPGETKQFVVGAKTGQIFMVDADSKDLEFKMIKGKDTAQLTEPGHYDSTLLADGDFVFEVKNTSKKEVKSSIKIIIDHTDVSK